MTMKEMHCRVSGRVQQVMFRDFVWRRAVALGVPGFVRNERDGTVTVVGQGNEDSLRELERALHTGSLFSRVDSVETTWREPQETFPGFSIATS